MKENNIESHNGLETLRILERYVQEGYLLHGSKLKIEVLEPRQATDTNKEKTARNRLGIYATENVRVAVSMALMHKVADESTSHYYVTNKDFRMGGTGITLKTGYVHVLPRDTFEEIMEEGDRELVSPVLVKPVAVIQIEPEILKEMNVVLEGDIENYFK
jgi:hypothetical protein